MYKHQFYFDIRHIKKAFFLILLIALSFLLSGCSAPNKEKKISATRIYLDTVTSITLYGTEDQQLLEDAFALIADYQDIFSRTQNTSEVWKLNHSTENAVPLSEPLSELVEKGLYYGELTDGAFDLSIAPVSSLWDFTAADPQVPSASDISKALSRVNYKNLKLNQDTLERKDSELQIDAGGIAKGYIADKVKEFLLSHDVSSALINLGGNILCVGSKPDGNPFQIGIEKPFSSQGEMAAMLEIRDLSVVTSGIYERCFEKDGKFYHHILDPATGYPITNNLLSVTIITSQSTDADALSTSCFVLGLEKGLELINSLPDTYAVFITDDNQLHYSDGLLSKLKVTEIPS